MIRAKRLEWKPRGLILVADLGYRWYELWQRDSGEWIAFESDDNSSKKIGVYDTLEPAKAACQAHADALAREIAEVGK